MSQIVYVHTESPLGPMIAGASEQGLCFLEWHDRGGVDRIITRVQKRYKAAVIAGNNAHLEQTLTEIAEYFDGKRREFTVPLHVAGTAFERRVWQELLAIPYGRTRSYGEMAALLDTPGAARAVGRANGANYISVIIPCHRVIESTGKLRGYGGGLWRKQWLLDLEKGLTPQIQPAQQALLLSAGR